jgi:hypothetical protein
MATLQLVTPATLRGLIPLVYYDQRCNGRSTGAGVSS